MRERAGLFTEAWEDLDWEPVEFIDAGDDIVVAVIAVRGSGRGSGVPLEARMALVYEVGGGKILRDRPFTSRSQALEAAGLSE